MGLLGQHDNKTDISVLLWQAREWFLDSGVIKKCSLGGGPDGIACPNKKNDEDKENK